MDKKVCGMWTCGVCGREFALMHENRYTVRNEERGGLAAAFADIPEPIMWDAFDCPYCGCQNRVHSRKREVENQESEPELQYACDDCGLSEVCPLSSAVDERDEENGR